MENVKSNDPAKKTTPGNGGGHKPSWWTTNIESSWEKVKADTISDWKKFVASEKKVENKLDERALAFGHGARKVYHQIQAWGTELEEKLKQDWKETTVDAEQAWDKVSATVKHGWERAVDAVKAPPPVAAVAAVPPPKA